MKNKGLKILLSVLLVLCIIMAGALIGTVSYTHLDVYKRQQAKKMADISDGAIVGSAIIKIIDEYGEASPKYVGEYVKAMKDAL